MRLIFLLPFNIVIPAKAGIGLENLRHLNVICSAYGQAIFERQKFLSPVPAFAGMTMLRVGA